MKKIKIILIVPATLMTESRVAVSSLICWIGLIISNLARLIFVDDYRIYMPASELLFSTFLVMIDGFCRDLTPSKI